MREQASGPSRVEPICQKTANFSPGEELCLGQGRGILMTDCVRKIPATE